MADHTHSMPVMESAFLEYIERQSLICNYLANTPFKEYDISKAIPFFPLATYVNKLSNEIRFFDISLLDNLHVILCIGVGKRKLIGLGTSFNLKEAINKSLTEALQYHAYIRLDNISDQKIEYTSKENQDYYHLSFEAISNKEFVTLYSYLLKNKDKISINQMEQNSNKEKKLLNLIKDCKEKLQMNPSISVFKPKHSIPNLKVVKIFDDNWFPNINPSTYANKNYDFVEEIIQKKFDRTISYIPFP